MSSIIAQIIDSMRQAILSANNRMTSLDIRMYMMNTLGYNRSDLSWQQTVVLALRTESCFIAVVDQGAISNGGCLWEVTERAGVSQFKKSQHEVDAENDSSIIEDRSPTPSSSSPRASSSNPANTFHSRVTSSPINPAGNFHNPLLKPGYTVLALICQAFLHYKCPLTLDEIRNFIVCTYPYYGARDSSYWNGEFLLSLTSKEMFQIEKGCWRIAPGWEGRFDEHGFGKHLDPVEGALYCICDKCSKLLSCWNNLEYHMITIHGLTQEHACPLCKKTFTGENIVQLHLSQCRKRPIRHGSFGRKSGKVRAIAESAIECSKTEESAEHSYLITFGTFCHSSYADGEGGGDILDQVSTNAWPASNFDF